MVVSGADSEIKTTSQNSNTGAATFREKKIYITLFLFFITEGGLNLISQTPTHFKSNRTKIQSEALLTVWMEFLIFTAIAAHLRGQRV